MSKYEDNLQRERFWMMNCVSELTKSASWLNVLLNKVEDCPLVDIRNHYTQIQPFSNEWNLSTLKVSVKKKKKEVIPQF